MSAGVNSNLLPGHDAEELLAPMDSEDVEKDPRAMVFDLWLPVRKK